MHEHKFVTLDKKKLWMYLSQGKERIYLLQISLTLEQVKQVYLTCTLFLLKLKLNFFNLYWLSKLAVWPGTVSEKLTWNRKKKTLTQHVRWLIFPAAKFGTSRERTECEKECREPCEHVEYRTSFSYSGLQKDAYIEYFMSILNDNATSAMELEMYRPLLNMTEEEKEKFIE